MRPLIAVIVLCSAGGTFSCGEEFTNSGPGTGGYSGTIGSGTGGEGARGGAGAGALGSGGAVTGAGGLPAAMGGRGGAIAGVGGTGANAPSSGGSGGATSSGGGGAISAGGAAMGGAGGATAGAGGATAGAGGAAAGGAGGSGDRCDVGVANPGKAPGVLAMSGDLGTHDPTVIEDAGVMYEFHTGPRLPGKTSMDLAAWRGASSAFSSNPSWIASRVPGATDLWAPDLSFFGGQYHLYYAASTFGKNTSCIGHATRARMNAGSFADQGSVICSGGNDDFNAIDPNLVVDAMGTPWLAFGSFWSGIKIVKLDATGARADNAVHAIASRNGGAIEAPYIVRRCGYYYLFVSFDKCCAGADSTYNIRVGRSADLLGPYTDKAGTSMMSGGGTRIVSGGGSFAAAGHNAVVFRGAQAYDVFHAYPTDGSNARLRVAELVWGTDGWPVSGGP